jgi:23S rRNA (cytidine1920-2'-O)/16S rRNA (cytidine1409-2'-O)-methyltransferase
LVGKGGLVRDEAARLAAVGGVADWLKTLGGWHNLGFVQSPILGGEGNVEFLLAARRQA